MRGAESMHDLRQKGGQVEESTVGNPGTGRRGRAEKPRHGAGGGCGSGCENQRQHSRRPGLKLTVRD